MTRPDEIKITFEPSGRAVYVLPKTTIFEAAARAGLLLQSPCGGKGTCGKCRVRVVNGTCEPTDACRRIFTAIQLTNGWRLACQARVGANAVVEVPAESLFDSNAQILTSSTNGPLHFRPAVWKKYVQLPTPTMDDDRSDLRRLEQTIDTHIKVDLTVLSVLPGKLRQAGFQGTATVCCNRLLDFDDNDTTSHICGIAFDLGTTTIVGTLMDLTNGQDLAVTATMNPQISSGDDVISRILQTRDNPDKLKEMQQQVITAVNKMITQLLADTGRSRHEIYEITVAGNTTMQHLFLGISPAALGEVPFPPAYNRGLFLSARELNLQIHPEGRLYVFPNIGGFVGGDTVAGILAATLHEACKPLLLVDIGTNGEIVLAHNGKLYATSTAAGPAFEGARITDGMRATDGAIEKVVRENGDICYNVIGNTLAAGICGTALIDITAELLRLGVIDTTGRILGDDELPTALPPAIRARLRADNCHYDFVIVPASESKTGQDICLYQRDVRELQLASGAIRAGVTIMLRKAGIEMDDLDEVLLAGAFGNFIRRSNARRIGLLPPIAKSRIRFIGNAASLGAKAVLLSQDVRGLADDIANRAQHIDLSADPDFQMEFGMAMMFPENDLDD